eukprot:143532-Prorocentrum_minimum.AAC.1
MTKCVIRRSQAYGMQLVESVPLMSGGPHTDFVHVNLYCDDKCAALLHQPITRQEGARWANNARGRSSSGQSRAGILLGQSHAGKELVGPIARREGARWANRMPGRSSLDQSRARKELVGPIARQEGALWTNCAPGRSSLDQSRVRKELFGPIAGEGREQRSNRRTERRQVCVCARAACGEGHSA